MNSITLSSFPAGLGLAAAAHVHLFKWSFRKIESQRAGFILHETNSKIDSASQTLLDLNSLTELLANAETLLRLESHSRPKDSRELGKSRLHQKEKNGTKSRTEPYATNSTNSANHSQNQEPFVNYRGGPSSSNTKRHSVQRRRRISREVRRSSIRRPVCDFSANTLEQWSSAYASLRKTQEAFMKLAIHRMKQTEPFYLDLLNNQAISVILGCVTTLHYLFSIDKFSTLLYKFSYRVGSFFRLNYLIPIDRLYIPWGLGPKRNLGSEGVLRTTVDVRPSNQGSTMISSFISITRTILQVAAPIFISGIHFFAATRAQLALHRIHKENQRQVQYTKRLSVISTFLSIREQRLTWLAREMREFEENVVDESENEDEDEDGYEDIVQNINDEAEGPTIGDGGEHSVRSEQGTSVRETRPTTSPENSTRPRYLAGDVHYRIFSFLQSGRGSDWIQGRSRGRETNGNQSESRQHHIPLQPTDSLQLLRNAFGPDLRSMNLDLFLNNPEERRRILRLEFEGIREELMLFREMALQTKI